MVSKFGKTSVSTHQKYSQFSPLRHAESYEYLEDLKIEDEDEEEEEEYESGSEWDS